jgi:hypothetical protein
LLLCTISLAMLHLLRLVLHDKWFNRKNKG